jgi:hypothetical protein
MPALKFMFFHKQYNQSFLILAYTKEAALKRITEMTGLPEDQWYWYTLERDDEALT